MSSVFAVSQQCSPTLLVTSILVTLKLAVADYPQPPPGTIDMCCNTVGDANDLIVQQTAASAGIPLFNLPGLFGIGCNATVVFSNPWYSSAHVNAVAVIPLQGLMTYFVQLQHSC
ncbi:hypothetical protein GGX14DRAFT_576431 [Mycena pura]|uniref:Hydrophobin n=1 Tax=Mycena pura TaxID=153505 RepID=A0AAD6XZS2_9AGAR|nr:hypothetical protein GGX14DRAFT_576431 [Mycena pura]